MLPIKTDWTTVKAFTDDRRANLQFIETSDNYFLYSIDNRFSVSCIIDKAATDTTDLDDFENNYKASANKSFTCAEGRTIIKMGAFSDAGNMRFRGTGVSGTANMTTTTNIDYKLPETRYINGLEFILKDHAFGDSAKFQVIDIDNILGYGANVVLDEFGTNWYVAEDIQQQGPFLMAYPAKVLSGLYLRIVYNSVGTSNNVSIKINYFLHKKTT